MIIMIIWFVLLLPAAIEYVSPEIEALQEKIAKDHGCEIAEYA